MVRGFAKYLAIAIVLAGVMMGCDKAPVAKEEMTDILLEIYRTDACLQFKGYGDNDSVKAQYYESVYRKHDITKEEFESALKWYADHPREMVVVYRNLSMKSDEYLKRVENYEFKPEAKPEINDSIDSLNIWYLSPSFKWNRTDDKQKVDDEHFHGVWDNRKYFAGCLKLVLSAKMRFYSESGDSVTTRMIVNYSKSKASDTLEYRCKADSVARTYNVWKRMDGRVVSGAEVMLVEGVDSLDVIDIERVSLKCAYNKYDTEISPAVRSSINFKTSVWRGDEENRLK
ncbi:MAG: DUF4296 domain-containing protein [Paludibacteraceae bacterium]|nr:DUF4296 domain-containing protein [Paludibacteraceae bacterium]